MGCGQNSLFGESNGGTIKYQGNDLVSIEGANILERLLLGGVSVPYNQILKGRVVLKPGEANYVMNHLGLGSHATFVAMVVKYAAHSKLEVDNYITYSYVGSPTINYPINQILTLSGNSTHRIPHIYLSNPNQNHSVTIDIMVASVDEVVEFSQSGPVITFSNSVYIGDVNGITQSGTPSTDNSSDFYTTIRIADANVTNIMDLVHSVFDDIDPVSIADIRVEFNGVPFHNTGITQSGLYSFSIVDTSYNLTEAHLYINLTI
jgi:hypothetical protein